MPINAARQLTPNIPGGVPRPGSSAHIVTDPRILPRGMTETHAGWDQGGAPMSQNQFIDWSTIKPWARPGGVGYPTVIPPKHGDVPINSIAPRDAWQGDADPRARDPRIAVRTPSGVRPGVDAAMSPQGPANNRQTPAPSAGALGVGAPGGMVPAMAPGGSFPSSGVGMSPATINIGFQSRPVMSPQQTAGLSQGISDWGQQRTAASPLSQGNPDLARMFQENMGQGAARSRLAFDRTAAEENADALLRSQLGVSNAGLKAGGLVANQVGQTLANQQFGTHLLLQLLGGML